MAGVPLNERVAALETQVTTLAEEVRSLKRSIVGTGFAIVGAVVIYLFRESTGSAATEAYSVISSALPF